ncbi:MAG: EAL domain-containing protein [Acidimicrobiales bacterium]
MDNDGGAPLHILLDASTRISAIHSELASHLGYEASQLLGEPFSVLLDKTEVEGVGKDLVSLVAGDQTIATSRRWLLAADNTPMAAVLSAEARRNQRVGFTGFSIAVVVDQDAATATTLAAHLRHFRGPAAQVNADATLIDTNLGWRRLFDAPGSNADGMNLFDLVYGTDRETLRDRFHGLVEGSLDSLRMEQQCRAETGPFWCRLSLTAVPSQDGYYTVTAEDISTEYLTNRILLANEALFRSLAEASPVGLARLAADLSITYASPSWLRLTGDVEGRPHPDMASTIHPDERERALNELRSRITTGSHDPVRARLAVGKDVARWASLRVASVSDDELGVIGHVITIEDVTDLVNASESQSQLAGIIESTSDLVGIADLRSGQLLYLNSAAQALFAPGGLTPGLDISGLYANEEANRYTDEIYTVLRRGETWSGEITMVRHDGQPLRVIHTVAAEIGADGEPERASVLGRDVTDQREALNELAYKATHDPLTELPNRTLLMDHIELDLARSERDRTPIAVLFIDLDRFKRVNDTYGHDAGDELLRKVAERMSSVLRPSDTVARMGGDEFVVLCEDIDGDVDAVTIAGRVRSAIEDEPISIQGINMQVSASVGIAISNGGSAREADTLLKRADTAMYRAKAAGRARTELFDEVRQDRNERRGEMIGQLQEAIENDSLELHYQPIVDLTTGRVTGVEAFVRWEHPTDGLLHPASFLGLVSESGLDRELDSAVLQQACRDATRWNQQLGAASPQVHVNITGASLISGDLAAMVERCLEATGLTPATLCLEFAESTLMADIDIIGERLGQVRALGVKLAIDDVGTAATVIPRLGSFPLDVLKIDGTLMRELSTNSDARQLVGGVVALGRVLGLTVGAESVEDVAALPILQSLGAAVAQGHVFSPAVPADKVEHLLTLRSKLVPPVQP